LTKEESKRLADEAYGKLITSQQEEFEKQLAAITD
jgi:hypothetical protein